MESRINEKNWSKDMEKPIYEEWKAKKTYRFDRKSADKVFSIDTPPPYVNTPIHVGQATTYVLMDMFARFQRMMGKSVLFPLGLDRNGLPIEMATEKKFNTTPFKEGREKLELLLEKGIISFENLANTDKLPEAFTFYGVPLNIKEADGSPVRAFAVI